MGNTKIRGQHTQTRDERTKSVLQEIVSGDNKQVTSSLTLDGSAYLPEKFMKQSHFNATSDISFSKETGGENNISDHVVPSEFPLDTFPAPQNSEYVWIDQYGNDVSPPRPEEYESIISKRKYGDDINAEI